MNTKNVGDMKIRIKRFSRRDEKVTWPLPENAKVKILVEEGTENYKKQLKDHPDKKRIKELRKELNDGFYYEDKPGDTYTDTHYLKDFSDPNSKNPEKRMLSYSKRINYFDRFNYFIYEPKDLGNNEYLLRIVPNSCKGHYAFGRRNYSIIKRIIQKIFNKGCPLEEVTVISSTKQSIEDIKKYLKTKSTAKCFSEKYDLNTGKRKDSDD